MSISDSLQAANAYKNMASQISKGVVSGGDSDESGDAAGGGASFMSMVKSAAADSIQTMKAGEQMSARAITGETSLPELIQAVSSAEMTLQTVVAVRDRMIGAYQEIMRMPV